MNRPASERDFPVKSHLNGRTAIFPYGNRRYHHVSMRLPARGSFQARTCSLAKLEIPKNQKTDRRNTRTPDPPRTQLGLSAQHRPNRLAPLAEPAIALKIPQVRQKVIYTFCSTSSSTTRPAGPMARRLTTNQEIAGSIPASVNENHCTAMHSFLRLLGDLISL